jgi:hypothetical protein
MIQRKWKSKAEQDASFERLRRALIGRLQDKLKHERRRPVVDLAKCLSLKFGIKDLMEFQTEPAGEGDR